MTRRDFQLICRVLRETNAPREVAEGMADALSHTNPKFDRGRFVHCAAGSARREGRAELA